jgi:hypothetical protein
LTEEETPMKIMVIYPPDEEGQQEKKFVIETNAGTLENALNEAFRRFNCVTGDPEVEDCVKFRVRSLSVGDVIRAPLAPDGSYYAVMGVGFKQITPSEMRNLMTLSFAERSMKCMGKGDV